MLFFVLQSPHESRAQLDFVLLKIPITRSPVSAVLFCIVSHLLLWAILVSLDSVNDPCFIDICKEKYNQKWIMSAKYVFA